MAASNSKHTQNERLDLIRQELLNTGQVSTLELSQKFNVSKITIHRDFELLEAGHEIVRTHGGAALAKKLTFEFAFSDKQQLHQDKKKRIARHAAALVKEGDVVLLDTGTTTLEISRLLAGENHITVITTSLAIVSELQFSKNVEVILLGGYLRGNSPDIHGPLTEQNVEQFRADVAFMGADAIDENGNTYTDDLRVVNLDLKIASVSAKVYVVADSSKFDKSAMCIVLTPKDYDGIITDSSIPKSTCKMLHDKKIEIQTAK